MEITDQSCYCSVSPWFFYSTSRHSSTVHFPAIFFSVLDKQKHREKGRERQNWSVWNGKIKRKGEAGEKEEGPDTCKQEGSNWKRRRVERAIGRVFMLWSVSVDRDERSKHASPLSPWSVSMETLFLTLTHIQYVHPARTVFPAVWTVWKSRELMMSFMWTYMQHRITVWLPIVPSIRPRGRAAIASTGLRLEPQFTQPSCNTTIWLSL